MVEVVYPPIMGLFCTGYVLHLAWKVLQRRRDRKAIIRWSLAQSILAEKIEIIWAMSADFPKEVRNLPCQMT